MTPTKEKSCTQIQFSRSSMMRTLEVRCKDPEHTVILTAADQISLPRQDLVSRIARAHNWGHAWPKAQIHSAIMADTYFLSIFLPPIFLQELAASDAEK